MTFHQFHCFVFLHFSHCNLKQLSKYFLFRVEHQHSKNEYVYLASIKFSQNHLSAYEEEKSFIDTVTLKT